MQVICMHLYEYWEKQERIWCCCSVTKSCCCCLVTKSCPTLCDPLDCSRPGSSVLHYLPEFAHLGPAAEPWRRAGSGPPPQASDSKGATRPQQGKAGLPLAPPWPAFSTEQEHAAPAPGSQQGTLGRSNPPAPHPGEAEAIKGRARVAGAQPGAKPWVCSVRINCWMTGWMRESRKGWDWWGPAQKGLGVGQHPPPC